MPKDMYGARVLNTRQIANCIVGDAHGVKLAGTAAEKEGSTVLHTPIIIDPSAPFLSAPQSAMYITTGTPCPPLGWHAHTPGWQCCSSKCMTPDLHCCRSQGRGLPHPAHISHHSIPQLAPHLPLDWSGTSPSKLHSRPSKGHAHTQSGRCCSSRCMTSDSQCCRR